MKRSLSFGPWSTGLDVANTSPLSRFWKRRLAVLAEGATAEPGVSRRGRVLLILLAVAAITLPTVDRVSITKATAQDELKQDAPESPAPGGENSLGAPPAATTPGGDAGAKSRPDRTPPRRMFNDYLPRRSVQGERVREALQERTHVHFDRQPLVDVLGYLEAYHSQGGPEKQIDIELDAKSLEDEGKTTDLPITGRITNVTLESALRLLLSQHDLAFLVADDVLKVTTKTVEMNTMLVRIYPVGDLVAPDGDFQALHQTIVNTIDPETWSDVGLGGAGSISAVPSAKSLVVRQSYGSQQKILELLGTLREARYVADQPSGH